MHIHTAVTCPCDSDNIKSLNPKGGKGSFCNPLVHALVPRVLVGISSPIKTCHKQQLVWHAAIRLCPRRGLPKTPSWQQACAMHSMHCGSATGTPCDTEKVDDGTYEADSQQGYRLSRQSVAAACDVWDISSSLLMARRMWPETATLCNRYRAGCAGLQSVNATFHSMQPACYKKLRK